MRLITSFLILLSVLLSSCQSSRSAVPRSPAQTGTITNNESSNIDLTGYIRSLPGVTVRGSGGSAKITVRGNSSIMGDSGPLFLVNGVNQGFDYAGVYATIDRNEIASVSVLRRPEEVSLYGVQGANGVIRIELKK